MTKDSSQAGARRVAVIGTRGYPSYYGGFETAVRHLAPHLVNAGWEVTVYGRDDAIKRNDPGADARVRSVRTPGLNYKSLSTLTYGFTSTVHALFRRPDVALVMNVANGYWMPLLRLRGIPVVTNVDGLEWRRQKWGRLAKAVFHTGARMTARWSQYLIFDALELRRIWEQEFRRTGEYIAYGAEVPTGSGMVPFEKGTYVLAVARLVPENSIDAFFEAARRLNGRYPVVVVGSDGFDGPYDAKARQLADEGVIHWMGHVSDDSLLLALWQNAGVYFHGHTVGGTNPALVQAMACGAPTIAADTPFNREVLGEAGTFVQANDTAIETAVMDLMSDQSRREQATKTGRARARALFDWEDVCAKYELLLRRSARTAKASRHGG